MQFKGIGRSSNFAQAGKSAADETVRAFAASRRNSTDFGKLTQKATNIRSAEKQAAIKAGAQVTKAGIEAQAYVKKNEIKLEGEQARDKGKRKAGALAAGGKLIAAAGQYGGEKRTKREVGSEDSYFDTRIEANKKSAADLRAQAENYGTSTDTSTPKTGTESELVATATPAPKLDGGITGKGIGGGDMDYMSSFVKQGYTPTHAAAIVGNMRYESGDFQFAEELAPNAYGTKGYGALQWTNAGDSTRRDDFVNWSKGQGLETNSFQANAGFAAHEMVHGDSKGRTNWTGGGGLAGFKGTTDLNSATSHYMQNYLRPAEATANLAERQRRAQDTLTRWQQQNN